MEMKEGNKKMYRRFEDLDVWQLGRKFRQDIYKLTKNFPKDEKYVLTPQIRGAGYSITANIAEGHGRYHFQENIQFCRIARGSINEVLDHLYTSLDNQYIKREDFQKLYEQGRHLEQVLNGYIAYLTKSKVTNNEKK